MKRWLALLLAALLLLAGCGSQNSAPDDTDENDAQVEDPTGGVTAPQGLSVQNARSFDIQYLADGVKLLIDSAGRELLLIPRGTRDPEGYENAVRVSTPVTGVMLTSPAQVSFLEALEDENLFTSIVALTMEESQWTNQGILDGGGQILYIDPEDWSADAIAGAAPGLVFLDASQESGAALAGLLDQMGSPVYAVAAENWEADAEGYLEWMKFFAAFYDLDREASDLYDAKLERLEALYAQGAAVPERQRPVAAFCVIRGGAVYTQAGGSAAARQLERAGAVYALRDLEGQGEVQMTMEEFSEKCKDADILIYAALPQDMAGTLTDEDPLFAEFKAYQAGRVFVLDNDYYRKSAQVVEAFEDLLAICRPELEADHVFTVYQPLAG